MQLEGFSRASLAFFDSYLGYNKGQTHSYALARLLSFFESILADTYNLKGTSVAWNTIEYKRLRVTVRFVRDAIVLLDKHGVCPMRLRKKQQQFGDTFDQLTDLAFEIIFDASSVSEPFWTCWSVQRNEVWAELFSYKHSSAFSVVLFKLRRLVYDEIKMMDKAPNFKSARIIGYFLKRTRIDPN